MNADDLKSHQKRRRGMKNAETEARVGLSVVDTETGEIKAEAECSLEDFQRLAGQKEFPGMPERQLVLFEGLEIYGNDYKVKLAPDALYWTEDNQHIFNNPLKIGAEIALFCSAKVVGVNFKRDKRGLVVREHVLEVGEVTVEADE